MTSEELSSQIGKLEELEKELRKMATARWAVQYEHDYTLDQAADAITALLSRVRELEKEREGRIFMLNDEDWAAFTERLDEPPAPNAKLRELLSGSAHARLTALESERDALREALEPTPEEKEDEHGRYTVDGSAYYNLMGAIEDLKRIPAVVEERVCLNTLDRILDQLFRARSLLQERDGGDGVSPAEAEVQ